MKGRVTFNSLVDLTPLLDVVFILLFAFLMSLSLEKNRSDEKVEELTATVSTTSQALELSEEKNDQLQTANERLVEQQQVLNESFIQWFTDEGSVVDLLDNPQVASLFDQNKTEESLYKMDFIANQFYFVDVKVDAVHRYKVLINDAETDLQLNEALFSDMTGKEQMKDMLFVELEKVLRSKQGGYRYVLLTLTDDGTMYKYAFDLIWTVFGELETKYGTDQVFKLQYLSY